MSSLPNKHNWRIGFAAFSLVYIAWVIYLGLDNFDKVHSEYRWAENRLQPVRVGEIALKELADNCRKETRGEMNRGKQYLVDSDRTAAEIDVCLNWPQPVLEDRQKKVADRLAEERDRLKRRLVTFYITFGVFFLVLPLVFLYFTLAILIWLFRDLKFMK